MFTKDFHKKTLHISSQSEIENKKTNCSISILYNIWISHVHEKKKQNKNHTQLHQYSRILSIQRAWLVLLSLALSLQNKMPKNITNTTSKILFLFKWSFPGRQDLFFLILVYRSCRILLFGCRPWWMGYCCQWKQIFNIWK